MRTYRPVLLTSAALLSLVAGGKALAAPEGGVVTRGSATITTSGDKTDIRQSSNKVILDWRSFDIGADEQTEFHQPSKNAIALNRISDTKASQINGKLTANGNIMLINPNGVVFGAGAQVDVGSLTATTADIDNDDFMVGKMDFKHAGATTGAIINNGTISVKDAGLVSFVAPKVENNGVIVARLGKVQLAAANTFTLDMAGDGILQVAISAEDGQKIARNSGTINAEGGYVAVTAARARGLIDSLVDNTGIIEASSMTTRGGKVILSAEGGTTKNSGTIKASGKTGGGEILIGGDYQGAGNTKNSKNTEIAQSSVIEASATDIGDGGKVIVWSDEKTGVAGSITAKGGPSSGKGGFVETSSKKLLNVDAQTTVSLGGKTGAGEWLVDPEDIVISDSGNDGNAATSDIAAATINGTLNGGGNVTVTTSGIAAGNGDITVQNANINKSVANNSATLTLQAHRNIVITNSTINSTSGNALNVVLNADRDANQSGSVSIGTSTINTQGGYLVAGGGAGTLGGVNGILGDGDGTGADDVAAWGNASRRDGVSLSGATISTGAGSVFIKGHGYTSSGTNNAHGILNSSTTSITTGSGNISLYGTAGDGTTGTYGGVVLWTSSMLETNGGKISVTGIDTSTHGDYGRGVMLNNTSLLAKNNASIEITGQSDLSGTDSQSVRLDSSTVETRGNGTITIDGAYFSNWGSIASNVGGAQSTGDIKLLADSIDFANIGSFQTSGSTYVTPKTAARSIGLGGGAGSLNLTDAELALFNGTGKLIIGDALLGTGDIDLDSWNWLSKNFSGIEIYGNDIDIGGVTMGAGNFMAYAKDNGVDYGDLNISANITRGVNGISTLDLRADRNITNSSGADIIASDANSDADSNPATSADSLNVILNADRNANQDGAISLTNATIATLGGNFIAGGGSGTLGGVNGILGDGDGTGADDVAAWGNSANTRGIAFYTTNITTGTGDIYLTGHGYNSVSSANNIGISIDGNIVTTSGKIFANGTGGTGTQSNYGFYIGSGKLSSSSGEIKVKGTGGGSVQWNDGILLSTNTAIESTGSATIDITGILGTGTGTSGFLARSGVVIGGASATGAVTFNTDSIDLNSAADIRASGIKTVKAITASTSIGLGGGAGSLNLTDAELAVFNGAGKLIIGDALLGTGDIDLDSWNWSSKNFSGIEIYGNDIDIGGVTMGAGNFMAYAKDNGVDYGDLTVSAAMTRSVAGVSALDLRADRDVIFNSGANVTATTGEIDLIIDSNTDNIGTGVITYNASSIDTNGGDITINNDTIIGANAVWNARGGLITSNGEIALDAFDLDLVANNLALGGNITGTAGSVLTLKPFDVTRSIGLGGGTGDFNLTDAELAYIGTDKLIIGNSASGANDIDLDSWDLSAKSVDVEFYGNDIDLGGITMGTGDFTAYAKDNGVDYGDLTVSAAMTRGVAGVSSLDLRADRDVIFNSGANITSTTGEIDVDIQSNYDNAGGGAIAYNANSISTNGGDITFNSGFALNADTTWNAGGGTVTTGGAHTLGSYDLLIVADNIDLGGNITGNTNSILTLKPYDNNRSIGLGGGGGGFNLTDAELSGLTIGHLIIGDAAAGAGDITIQSWSLSGKSYDLELYGRDMDINGMMMGGGDITMIAGRDVTVGGAIGNSGAGGDLYIDVGNDFTNATGVGAITMGAGGRFLIYIDDLSHITRGGMTTGNLFGRNYTDDAPSSIGTSFGNRFVFDETPTLTITANDVTLGAYDAGYNSFTYSLSGLVTGDTAASALGGGPAYGKMQLTPTTYRIAPSAGLLVSELGYLIAFQNGTLTMPVDPGTIPLPSPPATNPLPFVGLPASVEQQIQLSQMIFSEGYQVVTTANASFSGSDDNMLIEHKLDGFRVDTNEKDAFMRMVTGGYLQVDQPVVDYYGLSQYESDDL